MSTSTPNKIPPPTRNLALASLLIASLLGACATPRGPAAGAETVVTKAASPSAPQTKRSGAIAWMPGDPAVCRVFATFPGWDRVRPLPEVDAQKRPTLWYAVTRVQTDQQIAELRSAQIHVEEAPFIAMDGEGPAKPAATCAGVRLIWTLVPGALYNAIAREMVTQKVAAEDSYVVLPVPSDVADTTIAWEGTHPVSYDALQAANFEY